MNLDRKGVKKVKKKQKDSFNDADFVSYDAGITNFGIRTDCKYHFYYSITVPVRHGPLMRSSCMNEILTKQNKIIEGIDIKGYILETHGCESCKYFELHPSRKGIMK